MTSMKLIVRAKDLSKIDRTRSLWIPPGEGSIKINSDAGCFLDGSTGWGFVARDHSGNVLFAGTNLLNIYVSPTVAEAICA